MKFKNSQTDLIEFRGREIYIKRDDKLDVDFSGNKARKLYYYLVNEFPNIKRVVSYGQTNQMPCIQYQL